MAQRERSAQSGAGMRPVGPNAAEYEDFLRRMLARRGGVVPGQTVMMTRLVAVASDEARRGRAGADGSLGAGRPLRLPFSARLSRFRLRLQQSRAGRSHDGSGMLAARLFLAAADSFSRRGVRIDQRHNISLDWRHPAAPLAVIALVPLGLLAKLAIAVHLWQSGRHR